ncbi:D-alanyl-D-alanine carboxypeptidase family protein [Herbiconiux sp. A18JL235]|uniref:D-alanyl-D-alanine carboxypeptidase family protein n=1 Tax=Herbiconiux sp. A18JL235 TaxID=3152363 RepID=A0AB39BDY4_9MICO
MADSSAAWKALRAVGIVVGVFVILGIGVYGPATLVGPLPTASAALAEAPNEASGAFTPAMPETGASAVVADVATPVLATGGLDEAVPIAGTAKVVTALVVLSERPLLAGSDGPDIPITPADVSEYNRFVAESARAVPVSAGEWWSQREVMEAMLLGSSNNHADLLAKWAFGSVDAYLEAADAWLAARGLDGITLVDTNGLDEDDVGTASDLARVSALAFSEASIAEIMRLDTASLPGGRSVDNRASYQSELGYTGISRSYTDEAGVCFLFALDPSGGAAEAGAQADTDTPPALIYGAFLREPDWDTLDADLADLAASAAGTVAPTPVVSEGQSFVTYTTPWGETAHGVATSTESQLVWVTTPLEYQVDAKQLSTGVKGEEVGTVTVTTPDGPVTVRLELDGRIGDPGPLWRLLNPVPVITAFIDSRTQD